jgi:hypothetical protein
MRVSVAGGLDCGGDMSFHRLTKQSAIEAMFGSNHDLASARPVHWYIKKPRRTIIHTGTPGLGVQKGIYGAIQLHLKNKAERRLNKR